jgi:hypothetical protein
MPIRYVDQSLGNERFDSTRNSPTGASRFADELTGCYPVFIFLPSDRLPQYHQEHLELCWFEFRQTLIKEMIRYWR